MTDLEKQRRIAQGQCISRGLSWVDPSQQLSITQLLAHWTLPHCGTRQSTGIAKARKLVDQGKDSLNKGMGVGCAKGNRSDV